MGALIRSDKHLILNNRYALLGCIAVSAAGKVYRGRDLKQVQQQDLESRVLIHVLPKTTAAWSLAVMFEQICETTQCLRAPWILEAIAYGEDEDVAYVVLESPAGWEVQSLLSLPTIPQHCLRATRQQIDPLVKQGYLDAQTDPALLLCVEKETVYLLATAFASQIQALEKRTTQHPLMPRKHLGQALMTGTLLTLFGVFTAVAGNAVMELEPKPVPMVIPVTNNLGSAARLMLASLPSTAVTTMPVTQLDQPLRPVSVATLMPTSVEPSRSIKSAVSAAVVTEKKNQPAGKSVDSAPLQNTKKPKTPPAIEKPVEQPAKQSMEQSVEQLSIETPPVLAAHDSVDALIQQAYAAMQAGNLGSNGGALSFTRRLREQAAGHPQVARLGQEITAAYLRQVRVALQTNEMAVAATLLPTTRQLIQEFNLGNLTPAQQVLEDKVAELSQ